MSAAGQACANESGRRSGVRVIPRRQVYSAVACAVLGVLWIVHTIGAADGSLGLIAIGTLPTIALLLLAAWLLRTYVESGVLVLLWLGLGIVVWWFIRA